MKVAHKPYPTDGSDEEWAFVAPYLTLRLEDCGQRRHDLLRLAVGRVPDPTAAERSFAWAARFRRLARDDERLPATLAGLPFVAFACLMLVKLTFQFQGG